MPRRQKDPLRPLTAAEYRHLARLSRATSAAVASVVRAQALLAVAAGQSFTAAAASVDRRSGDAVAHLVGRFNREGLAALEPRHGGGPHRVYDPAAQARILTEAARPPDREQDTTATWSLATLQRALRRAPDGLPAVSTYTIWRVLHDAGLHWQRTRTWCPTGTAQRVRKSGTVTVTDPDTVGKKT